MRIRRNSVDSILNNLPTEQLPLSEEEKKRVLNLALQKAAQRRISVAPPQKRRSQLPVRAAAFFAAACLLTGGAAAAAPVVGDLVSGKISFFSNAKKQDSVQNPMDAPRGDYAGQQADLESHNITVGQTVTLDGVNYTLDTLSMDSASLDCFFTISGKNVVSKFLDSSIPQPEWYQLGLNAPFLLAQINEDDPLDQMQDDLYRKDDNSFQYWAHYQLPTENAKSITFTPVYSQGEQNTEYRTVTTAEMEQGVQIAISDVGGYTLQNFKAQGQALTWQMIPYGYAGPTAELFPQDEAYIDTNTNSYALISSQVDPTTGIITCRQDYYTADPAQVAKISEFQYIFTSGYAKDETKSITLPLE